MKIILNCLFVLISALSFSQNTAQISISNSKWNKKTILDELFGKTYIDVISSAKWKPYPGEVIQQSFDGYCYTTIDSIYNFKNEANNYQIVVLKTFSYFDEGFIGPSMSEGGTVGLALFIEEKNNWNLVNFNRSVILNGAGGLLGEVEIYDLGNNSLFLSLKDVERHEIDVIQYLFSLNSNNFGMNIFSTKVYHRVMDDREDVYKYESSEFIIQQAASEDEWPVMVLTKKRTTLKDDIESSEVLSTSVYKFDGIGFY
jgi:hypothetical protein